MDKRLQQALEDFNNNYNCSQTVSRQFAEDYGLTKDLISRLNAGFGGGMCIGYTCGAITGAIMVLGLKYAKTDPTAEDKKEFYAVVHKFLNEFKVVHGALNCHELIGYEAGNEIQKEQAREKGIFKDNCPKYIKTAIELVLNY
ncbi:MAG TPA: C-GCAxxG-C-C family protein [Candidatus Cloacimonadota bacterium]|nr:C-GCAxxG-C-C family protein [Candidatus Cloacimonadota bacterium]HPK41067.1 C-GCAxxG-C-C family protein [Candidatus Cloacimonadota bacterium]